MFLSNKKFYLGDCRSDVVKSFPLHLLQVQTIYTRFHYVCLILWIQLHLQVVELPGQVGRVLSEEGLGHLYCNIGHLAWQFLCSHLVGNIYHWPTYVKLMDLKGKTTSL